jgi:NAD(P)-dependent dehydrogenase (short-subunit alcohol dehydrogenase family)
VNSNDTYQGIDPREQVAIVTGGGRGIGRAIALALAKAGAAVAVVARTEEQLAETVALIEGAGGRAIAFPADVTDRRAVEQMVAQVERQMGPVDLLVNNAGHEGQIAPFWEAEPDEWWRCIDVNLRGPFLCARTVVPGMITRRRGRIITTASGAALGRWPYASAYVISKCAVIRLTENLAAETREHRISVFAINPGFVRTAMTEAAAESPEDEKWLGGLFRKSFSAGRDVPPERAAQLVVFLASGKADVLSGCFVSVSDDVAEMVSRAKEIQENELYTLRLRR